VFVIVKQFREPNGKKESDDICSTYGHVQLVLMKKMCATLNTSGRAPTQPNLRIADLLKQP
jgi:hypothetical protein